MLISFVPRPVRVLAAFFAFSVSGFAEEDPGAEVFRNICAACHGNEGLGVPGLYPPLADSPFLKGDPAHSIRIVLYGLEGPVTVGGEVYNSAMPPNSEILTDEDIAAVLNHARGYWGDGQSPVVTAGMVAAIRAETPDRGMWTIAELEALAAKSNEPVPVANAAPVSATASPVKDPSISPPVSPDPRLPWLRLVFLSLPMIIFLLGVSLLPDHRR